MPSMLPHASRLPSELRSREHDVIMRNRVDVRSERVVLVAHSAESCACRVCVEHVCGAAVPHTHASVIAARA